jgi:hypothetical protein
MMIRETRLGEIPVSDPLNFRHYLSQVGRITMG